VARPRKKGNLDLPLNLYRGDNGSYRYRHPTTGKFHSMGTDKLKAYRAAQKLNDMLIPVPDLVAKVLNDGEESILFKDFAQNYLDNLTLRGGRPIAENTLRNYRSLISRMNTAFGDVSIADISLKLISNYFESVVPSAAQLSRSILCSIFDIAVAKGLRKENVARMTLPVDVVKKRKRHTIEGLMKIRAASPDWLQNAIDIAFLTTQRRVDICNMKWSDIKDGYLYVAQQKTTKESDDAFDVGQGAGYVRIKINEELQAILDRCKSDLGSKYIIHNKDNRIAARRKTMIQPNTLSKAFTDAVIKSKAYPKLKGREIPTFHEIRALAIFLHKKEGLSAQELAGHSSKNMTQKYESGHDIVWNDAEIGISLSSLKNTA
jgi:enterobacteria phage integrase